MAVEGLNFDEKVAEVVRNYRVFYDKQGRHFKYRKKNTQAWNEEATEMGMKKVNYGTTGVIVI